MLHLLILFCLIFMVISVVVAVMTHSIIKSVIALAFSSICLTLIMFIFGATWAAVFELSVCTGLVTVIIVSTISMTSPKKKEETVVKDHATRFSALPFLLILSGIALIAIVIATGFTVNEPSNSLTAASSTFQNVFWNLRQADVLGQTIVILAGALAVVVLFKDGESK